MWLWIQPDWMIRGFTGVVILTAIANRVRLVRLGIVEQFIMSYGGLRGAIAFALAVLLDERVFPDKHLFITTTIVVIYFTNFVMVSARKLHARKRKKYVSLHWFLLLISWYRVRCSSVSFASVPLVRLHSHRLNGTGCNSRVWDLFTGQHDATSGETSANQTQRKNWCSPEWENYSTGMWFDFFLNHFRIIRKNWPCYIRRDTNFTH